MVRIIRWQDQRTPTTQPWRRYDPDKWQHRCTADGRGNRIMTDRQLLDLGGACIWCNSTPWPGRQAHLWGYDR